MQVNGEDYLTIRQFCFDAIEEAIKKIESTLYFPKCPPITPLEQRLIDKLREETDDPTFWF